MSMTTRKMTTRTLLLSTAVFLAGVGVASAQGMNEGTGARGQGQAAGSISNEGAHGSAGGGQHMRGSSNLHSRSAEGQHGVKGATVGAGEEGHGAVQMQHGNAHGNAQGNVTKHEQNRTTGQAMHGQASPGRIEHNRTTGQAAHEQTRPNRTEHNAQHHATTHSTTGQGSAEIRSNAETRGNANIGTQSRVGTHTATRQSSNVRLNSRQRTRIEQSVLTRSTVPRLSRVGFALDPGVIVPDSVHYVSISDYPALVDVFPAYRDDYFFVAEDQIIVLTPQRRIVAVVPLGGGPRYGAVSAGIELSSTEIREVQQVLVDRGYDIQADGVWGPSTRRALIEFQQREGLPATGVITARTVTSLGLQGRIAESHIQRGAATTGSNVRENTRTDVRSNQPNTQRGPNANPGERAPRNRATTGRGNGPNPQGANQPAQNRATSGQGNNQQPQNKSTNGRGGNQSMNGPSSQPQNRSTTGQGSQPNAQSNNQPAQNRATNGEGNNQQSGTSGMQPSGGSSQNNTQMNKPQK